MSMKTFLVVGWVLCGLLAAGIFCADRNAIVEQRSGFLTAQELRENKRRNLSFCLIVGVAGGPISLVASLAFTGFAQHGWRLN